MNCIIYLGWIVKYWWLFGKKRYVFIMAFIEFATDIIIVVSQLFFAPLNIKHRIVGYLVLNGFFLLGYSIGFIFFLVVIVRFNDYWNIKNEMKCHLISIIIMFISIFIIILLTISDVLPSLRMGFAIGGWGIVSTTSLLWGTSIIYVEMANTKYRKLIKKFKEQHGNHGKRGTRKSIIELLGQDKGYELFMDHLEKEFATENLLYITTLIQFQELLIELKQIKGNDTKMLIQQERIKIADSIPKLIEKEFSFTEQIKSIKQRILKRKHGNKEQMICTQNVMNPLPEASPVVTDFVAPTKTVEYSKSTELSILSESSNNELAKVINGIYFKIYKKYIQHYEAKLQINIPSRLRDNLKCEYNEI